MASLGTSAGYPQFAGQASGGGKYTPEIFSQKALIKFYLTTVFGEIANTDYEGEIRQKGDKVIIRTVPDITIRDYVKGQDLVYESPTAAEVELEINKAKYYATRIDKIDEVQNDVKLMDWWSDDAGKQLAIKIDTDMSSATSTPRPAWQLRQYRWRYLSGYNLGTDATPICAAHRGLREQRHQRDRCDHVRRSRPVRAERARGQRALDRPADLGLHAPADLRPAPCRLVWATRLESGRAAQR
jgi:hypothetical protein